MKALGYKSTAKLSRLVSCNHFVANIKTPLLVLAAHDDVVTKTKHIPLDDLKRLPNAMMAIYERGGHCDFFFEKLSSKTGKTYHKEFMPEPTFAFFDLIQESKNV